MISDDEFLERIVAAIQEVTTDEADVAWNELINGRQFDVVVRFQLGALRYLVLVEVKNRKRKTAASDIEAFVTKARDQAANKMVFVNAAGYQSGAKEVATRHDVDIFTVNFDYEQSSANLDGSIIRSTPAAAQPSEPPNIEIGPLEEVLAIEKIELHYQDGESHQLPDESTQMQYYLRKTKFNNGEPLESAIDTRGFGRPEIGKYERRTLSLPHPRRIKPPDEYFFPGGILESLDCSYTTRMYRSLKGNVQIEPTAFSSPVVYTNVITGESYRFSMSQLPLGNSEVAQGQFYFTYHPLRYYYCAAINEDLVEWWLIESFQNSVLTQAAFTQKTAYARHYIPVSEPKTLDRLALRLRDFRARRES